jgi:hypothetical protein
VHSIFVAEDAAASYSQSIYPNLIFLMVPGVGPGCGLDKVLEPPIDLSHCRVISGGTTTSGTVTFGAAVVLVTASGAHEQLW